MKKRMAALLGGAVALATLSAAHATMPVSQSAPHGMTAVKADNATGTRAHVELVRDRDRDRRHRRRGRHHNRRHDRDRGGFWPGAAFGAVIGGMLAAPRYEAVPDYDPDVAWCVRHYRSYDVRSGTYLGYDGYRHPCP